MTEMTQSRQCELLEHDMTAEHVKGFKEEDLYLTTAEYLKKNVNDDNKKEIISDMKDFLSSCERNNTERLPCKENNTNSQSLLKQTCQFRDKAKVAKDKESASLVRERNLQKLHQILIDPIKDPRIIPTDPITSEHNSTTNGWYKETIWIIFTWTSATSHRTICSCLWVSITSPWNSLISRIISNYPIACAHVISTTSWYKESVRTILTWSRHC